MKDVFLQRRQLLNIMIMLASVLIGILIFRIMHKFDQTLELVSAQAQQQTAQIAIRVGMIQSHLELLQSATEHAFYIQDPSLGDVLKEDGEGKGYFISKHSHALTGWEFGNLIGEGRLSQRSDSIMREQSAILSVTPLLRTTKTNIRFLERAFYKSENGFLYMYPWFPAIYARLDSSGSDLRFEQHQALSKNLKRHLWWSDIYESAGKRMITAAIPVYFEGQLKGTIGLDFSLAAIAKELKSEKLTLQKLWMLTNFGEILDVQDNMRRITDKEKLSIGEDVKNISQLRQLASFHWGWGSKIELNNDGAYMLMVAHKKDVYLKILNELWLEIVFCIVFFIGIVFFVKIRLMRKEMRFYESHDRLTGMYNRNRMMTQLQVLLQTSERQGLDMYIGLIELIGLQNVNHNYGHQIGDDVLEQYSSRLGEEIGREHICRWGGERFLFYCENEQILKSQLKLLEKVIAKPVHCYDEPFHLQHNIGIAHYPQDAHSVSGLVSAAGQALQRCEGFGCVSYYEVPVKQDARPGGSGPDGRITSG